MIFLIEAFNQGLLLIDLTSKHGAVFIDRRKRFVFEFEWNI